jgi:DNA-binding CsgD family transcriptional regulator
MPLVGGAGGHPLRGRDEELATIGAKLDKLRSGVGSVIIVEGRAGLGKTRLLEGCALLAAERSFRVGSGAAEPGRGAVELTALYGALFEGSNPLVARAALSDVHASPEQTFWLLQDIQALIEEAALKDPLVLCFDDLQWGGQVCAEAMRQLPQRLAPLPVCWVMAFRPEQGIPQVQVAKDQLENFGAEMIRLGPLTRNAVAEIATDLLSAEPDEELLHKAEQVQGNPFLLIEFFRGLQDDGILRVESGKAMLLEDRLPRRVSDNMRGRLLRMSPAAERLATLASALGRRFSVTDLAKMTRMPIADLLDPIKELVQADIFVESDDQLAFGHDLVREAVRASSPVSVRRALDRQAADVLLDRGALPVEVAQQLSDSAEPGDDTAITTLLQAADALARGDPDTSATLAGRGLELAPARHPLRGPLVARRAISLFAAGLGEEGRQFADTALRQALPAQEEARVRFSVASMFDLSPDLRADNARKALVLPDLTPELRASLWGCLFHNLVVAGRIDEALAVEDKAREAVYSSGSHTGWVAFELPESAVHYQLYGFDRGLEILQTAERRGLDSEDDPRERLAHNFRSWLLAAVDRYEEALETIDEGVMAAQRDRQNWALRVFEGSRGRQMLQMGQLSEAAVALEGRYSVNEAHLVVGVLEAPSVVALGKLKIHTRDERAAAEVGEIAKIMLQTSAPSVRSHAAWYLALHAMSLGKADEAHNWLCTSGHDNRLNLFPLFPFEIVDDPQLVRIAVTVGDDELAEHTIEQAEQRCELNPDVTSFRAAVAHSRGLWRRSTHDLQTAVTLFATGPRPLATASALEDLGRLQVSEGAKDDAIASFDAALAIVVRVGAIWDAARVRGRLRDLGVRRRIVLSERPTTGWGALTSAEAAIAELVSAGKTNREIGETLFVSPHTVNTHLRHIFDKLGVNSRVSLTRMAETLRTLHTD